jgi:hypothetical protein
MATEQGEPVRDATAWLEQTRVHATVLSEAHRLRLTRRLWWVNFFLVVVPAVFSTAAAIFAARQHDGGWTILSLPPASAMAGAAAVLLAIHKALKCEEYQAESLRVGQEYDAIATSADSALYGPVADRESVRKDLTAKLTTLAGNAKAQLPMSTDDIQKAATELTARLAARPGQG